MSVIVEPGARHGLADAALALRGTGCSSARHESRHAPMSDTVSGASVERLQRIVPPLLVMAAVDRGLVGRGRGNARARSSRRRGRWSPAPASWRRTARCGSTSARRCCASASASGWPCWWPCRSACGWAGSPAPTARSTRSSRCCGRSRRSPGSRSRSCGSASATSRRSS